MPIAQRMRWAGATVLTVLLALNMACLSMVNFALAASDSNHNADVLGHVSVSVPSGGQFSPSQADVLARAKAWLDGLEMTARTLGSMDAVRLAGLDFFQMQALAALLGRVENAFISRSSEQDAQEGPDKLWPEASSSVTLRVGKPDAAAVSQTMANVEGLARLEELIIALRRLLPEALEWAERGHELRTAAASSSPSEKSSLFFAPSAPDDIVAARLSMLTSATSAALAYADFLLGAPVTPELQSTLDWAHNILPPLAAARADMLLRQDRPQAALQILRDLSPPAPGINPKRELWMQSRSSTWPAVWTSAWPSHPSDTRLYARALYLRGLAQLRSGQPALAEADLSAALSIEPQRPDFLLARGATYQVREIFDAMCRDYYQACTLGSCDGLAAAREQQRCLPQ